MDKLGSKKYPIIITPEISTAKNPELKEKRRRIFVNEQYIKPNKAQNSSISSSPKKPLSFTINVISNPNLGKLDIKCALYLYDLLSFDPVGGLITTKKGLSPALLSTHLGEDDQLYTGFNEDCFPFVYISETKNLLDNLHDINIKCAEKELNDSLQKLHHFGYITVTDVSWENVQVRAKNIKIKTGDLHTDIILCKHVSIGEGMDTHDLSKRWLLNEETDVKNKTMLNY